MQFACSPSAVLHSLTTFPFVVISMPVFQQVRLQPKKAHSCSSSVTRQPGYFLASPIHTGKAINLDRPSLPLQSVIPLARA